MKKAVGWFFVFLAVWAVTFTAVAEETRAGDAVDYEDAFSGFDDEDGLNLGAAHETMPAGTSPTVSRYRLGGALTMSNTWSVNHKAPPPGQTDFRGLSRLRAELDLEFRADLYNSWRVYVSGRGTHDFVYAIKGRDEYTRQVLDEYESELEFRETYLQGSLLSNLDITIGRQIFVWGNTENFRVTDVLNPEDNRDPGLVDIEYLRMPVCAIKADIYWDDPFGRYSLTGLAIPELRYDKNPVYGYDFYPLDNPMPPDNPPSNSLRNTELAMALTGIFHNWDLSLYVAGFYDNKGYFKHLGYYREMVPTREGVYVERSIPILEQRFSRLKMAGLSADFAVGNWLLKTELAWTDGHEYNNVNKDKSRRSALAGFEYMGFSNTTLTLEFTQAYIHNFEPGMREWPDYAQKRQSATALRINKKWMNDRLEGIFLVIAMGDKADDGAFERFSLAYDISDALTVTGGCVLYQSGEAMMVDGIHHNNRLFLKIKYSF